MRTHFHNLVRTGGERGAALVEFALILPLFMTLFLGMFSGALAYSRDSSLTHATREAARYAVTLPKGTGVGAAGAWTTAVATRAEEAAAGDLDAITTPQVGHYICVALVTAAGTVDGSYSYQSANVPAGTPSNCYSDGLTDTAGRVHVMVGRPGKIELLVLSFDIRLGGKATARFEDLS